MTQADIVIVGSGHGGARAALALRKQGFAGSILMVSRDSDPPYRRPPLSKDYLAGTTPFEEILIRPPEFWAEAGIALRLGTTVTRIDPVARTLAVARGDPIGYSAVIWAAGGDPRRLSCPGAHLPGIHTLRTRADADRLREEAARGGRRVVVIGGDHRALEAAAVLAQAGCAVVLLEPAKRVLSHVAGADLSRFLEAEHRAHGVDLRCGATLAAIEGDARVSGVRLDSGETIACDVVVAAIGIVPAVGPLIAAGAAGADGVDVDELCRTSLPDLYAIGDCAAHASPYADHSVIRLESVQNAHDMAEAVARTICGDPQPYAALPRFWSDQYDLRLESAGLTLGHDTTALRGSPQDRSFSVFSLKAGRVVALDCVNAPEDLAAGCRLIEAGTVCDPAALADPATPLGSLA